MPPLPPPGARVTPSRWASDEASQVHTAGGTMDGPRGLCSDNDNQAGTLGVPCRDSLAVSAVAVP